MAKNEDVLILPADKGKSTVIMDKCYYIAKLDKMVSDTKVYELLKTDPTPKFKNKLVAMLTNLKQVGKNHQKTKLPFIPYFGHDTKIIWVPQDTHGRKETPSDQ